MENLLCLSSQGTGFVFTYIKRARVPIFLLVCKTVSKAASQRGGCALRRSDWAVFKGSVSPTAFLQRWLKKKKRPAGAKAERSLKASDLQRTHIHLPPRAPLSSHFAGDPGAYRARRSPAPAAYGSAPAFPCPPVAIPPGLAG